MKINTFLKDHKKSLVLLFTVPLLYTIIFGFAYKSEVVENIPTVVYDQDQSNISRILLNAISDSEKYKIIAYVDDKEAMNHYLNTQQALVGIEIPENFNKDIKLSRSPSIMVITNASNLMFHNAVMSSINQIIQTISAATGQKILEGANQLPSVALHTVAPFTLSVRILNNPETSYNNFMLLGLGLNGLQIVLLILLTPIFSTITNKTFSYRSLSETSFKQMIFPYWLCSIFAFILMTYLPTFLFHLPNQANIMQIILLGSAFTIAIISICCVFSAATPDAVTALQAPLLYIMPGLLFSGLSWPQYAMNDYSLFLSNFMPITYTAELLRSLVLSGSSIKLYENVLTLYLGALICLVVSVVLLKIRLTLTKGKVESV